MQCGILQGVDSRVVKGLPLIGQPLGQLADEQGRQVDQQLREIELRINIMSAAGAGQAGQDGGCSSAARVAHEKRVLAIENNALHLALGYVLVDGHCAIRGEDVQFRHCPRA
jgi:hypothetical protein